MRILIMVVSTVIPPYYEMAKHQQKTWDSVRVDGIETVYYYSGEKLLINKITDHSKELIVECSNELHKCHWRFKLALDNVNYKDFDLIFRTNNSSYVNKKELLKFAETLPKEKCYCGIDGDNFASGAGFLISKDCIEILLQELTEEDYWAEDHLYGKILSNHGIKVTEGAKRIDIIDVSDHYRVNEFGYHYRCKHGKNRSLDLEIMSKLFELYK